MYICVYISTFMSVCIDKIRYKNTYNHTTPTNKSTDTPHCHVPKFTSPSPPSLPEFVLPCSGGPHCVYTHLWVVMNTWLYTIICIYMFTIKHTHSCTHARMHTQNINVCTVHAALAKKTCSGNERMRMAFTPARAHTHSLKHSHTLIHTHSLPHTV